MLLFWFVDFFWVEFALLLTLLRVACWGVLCVLIVGLVVGAWLLPNFAVL